MRRHVDETVTVTVIQHFLQFPGNATWDNRVRGNSPERPTLIADAVRIAYEAWGPVGASHAKSNKDKSIEHESQRIDVLLRP
jgi:hypothetical protein